MLIITTQTPLQIPSKLGKMNKAQRIIGTRQRREGLEDSFLLMAFKDTRSENQRNERQAKRK